MTLYSFVLFIHVVSAMGLFVGLALEGFVSLRIRVAQDAEQLQLFIRAFNLLLGGLYLASKYGGGTFWIPAALIDTLAIMFVGGLITGRKINQLRRTLGKADAAFEALSARANDELVTLSYGLRSGLAFGIVFLMTAKPSLWPSVFALVAGCADHRCEPRNRRSDRSTIRATGCKSSRAWERHGGFTSGESRHRARQRHGNARACRRHEVRRDRSDAAAG